MSSPPRSSVRALPAVALLAALPALGCAASPGSGDKHLLSGLKPTKVQDVRDVDRMTDGIAPDEGDFWDTDLVSRVLSPASMVEWDLGKTRTIRCAALQGDDNDLYQLMGSADGQKWSTLWDAGPMHQAGSGMRMREGRFEGNTRYLRLTASGGDGLYSVGEVAVYETCPERWPPEFERRHGATEEEGARTNLLMFAGALALFLLLNRRGSPWWRNLLVLLPVLFGYGMVRDLVRLYPFWKLESLLRGVIAGLAFIVVLREAFARRGREPDPRWMRGVLAVLALGALGCYYHFGALQFYDAAKGRHSLVHPWDMRHYFPLAKYFRELRFDGLYAASAAAYVDLHPGMTVEQLPHVKFRDLRDSEMRYAVDMADHIRESKARFSPERWEEFKRDMKYFLDNMGSRDYLGGMQDHGGNATPVWILGAWPIFSHAHATELTLSLAALIDPLLVLTLFFFVWRCFGVRVMLYVVILFGATDFYQFGSNLVGSTLRQDWLVAAGLGACAIRKKRPFLGGLLLAYSGLIRAFPAVAAMALPIPIVWALIDFWRARRRLPGRDELRDIGVRERESLRATAGAAVAVVVLVGITTGMFGWKGSWGSWIDKIKIHATGPSVNNVGLRNVLMFEPSHIGRRVIRDDRPEPWEQWQRYQVDAFARRKVLFYAINLIFAGLVLLAARKRPLEQVAMLGLLTVPYIFYPSNYYCHFVFLLPMGAASRDGSDPRDRGFALGVASLLAICVAQYFTMAEGWADLRYTYQSFALLGGFLTFVLPLAWEGWRDLRGPRPAAGPATAALEGPPSTPSEPDPQPAPGAAP